MATQQAYDNALRNSGGNPNSPLFKQWLAQYGPPEDAGSTAVPTASTYGEIIPQYYSNLSAGMRGELPAEALGFLAQQAAERGVSSGMPGSEAAKYAGLTNLRDVMMNRILSAEQQISPIEQQRQKAIQQMNMMNYQREASYGDWLRQLQEQRNAQTSAGWANQPAWGSSMTTPSGSMLGNIGVNAPSSRPTSTWGTSTIPTYQKQSWPGTNYWS